MGVFLTLLLAVGAASYAQYEPWTFLHGDGAFYATMNRSLLEGTLKQREFQPNSWYERPMGWNLNLDQGWSNVAQGPDGTWWPKHPILLPILGTPLYWLLGPDGALWTNMLLLVLGLWSAARLASRVADPTLSALMALGFATLPLVTHSAYSYSNDVLYGTLVMLGVELFAEENFLFSGLFLGFAVWCKPTVAMFPALLGLTLLLQRKWRPALRMVLGGLPGISAMLLQNWLMFGGPLTFSYDRIIVTRGGRPALESASVKMHRPLLQGLKSVWQDESQGLIHQVVWGLGALLGTPLLIRALPVIGLTFLLSLGGYAVFYAKYDYTYARFYLPWLLLSIVPATQLLEFVVVQLAKVGKIPLRIRVVTASLAVLLLFVGVALARRPHARWSAAQAIGHAQVERGDLNHAIPCDYFNPRWQRWECAQVDNEPWLTWGLARGEECQFPGEKGPWLWLHPNPGVARRITFSHLPPASPHLHTAPLHLRYGLAPKSHFTNLMLRLQPGGQPPQTVTVTDIGRVHELNLPAPTGTFTLEVPEQPADWRQLCVQLEIP